MNFAEFLRTPFFYRTPPVAASGKQEAEGREVRHWEKMI